MNDQLPNPEPPPGKSGSLLFWIALLAPAIITLTLLAFGKSSREVRDTVTSIFMVNFFVGAAAAIYCGVWLAKRFCKPGGARVFAALSLIFVIGLLNIIVTFAGCVTVAPMDFL
jgi:hypothetical protein